MFEVFNVDDYRKKSIKNKVCIVFFSRGVPTMLSEQTAKISISILT